MSQQANEPLWQWWASRDEENYTIGPCGTREEALVEGRDSFGDDGEGFYIVEAVQSGVDRLMPDAQRIIETALENAADDGQFGEDGDFDLRGPAEQGRAAYAELDSALTGWFGKWKHLFPVPWAFARSRNGEFIAPPEAEPTEESATTRSAAEADAEGPG